MLREFRYHPKDKSVISLKIPSKTVPARHLGGIRTTLIRLCEDETIIKLFKGLLKTFTKDKSATNNTTPPVIVPRALHNVSRNKIGHNALKVLYRLHNAGYSAYLVGGCVRDILLEKQPKDFDIATDALPEEIHKLFRNCRIIGRRFRLAHIVFGKEIIEVATFRTHHKDGQEQHGHTLKGMIIRDNMYGTIEDDAWRRDFTVNALYYNIADFSVIDYTHGMQDLQAKLLRVIGDPEQRFHEDPVRLLRAIRFAGKLQLTISPETEAPIIALSHLLQQVSSSRLFQEVLKFFQEGATLATFRLLQKYQLAAQLFPQTTPLLSQPVTIKLLEEALSSTDSRIQEEKSISPAFLFAVFLWHPVLHLSTQYQEEGLTPHIAYEKALKTILKIQTESLAIPRRLLMSIHDICFLQHRLTCRYGSTPVRLINHPRFRAAYDLLILRGIAGEPVQELSDWWTAFHVATSEQQTELLKQVSQPDKKKRRPRKRGASRSKKPVS